MKKIELPDVVVKAMFENVVSALKTGKLKEIGDLPKYALEQYFLKEDKHFSLFQYSFIEEYVENESMIEGAAREEKDGLKEVYEYIFSNPYNTDFDIYYLLDLHKILYSKTPFPEVGGCFRKEPAHLNDSLVSLADWYEIPEKIDKLNKPLSCLIKDSLKVLESQDIDIVTKYIEDCLKLNCQIIQIHPFFNGNSRTSRAFVNKLFVLAGIPPVYIHNKEKELYRYLREQAILNNDYEDFVNFYIIKICQSIYELKMNPNGSLKRTTKFYKIKNIVENYKAAIGDVVTNLDDMSYECAKHIHEDLENENIKSSVHAVTDENGDEYLYLTSAIDSNNSLIIINPLFSNYVKNKTIYLSEDLTDENKDFLKELYHDGVAYADIHDYELYLKMYGAIHHEKSSKQKQLINN